MRTHSQKLGHLAYRELLSLLWPLTLLGVILALLLYGFSWMRLSFASRASETNTIRIWTEPATVLTRAGVSQTLAVYAAVDNDKQLIPQLTVTIRSDSQLVFSPQTLLSKTALAGKSVIGTLSVSPTTTGDFLLTIAPEDVQFANTTQAQIHTTGTRFIVQ